MGTSLQGMIAVESAAITAEGFKLRYAGVALTANERVTVGSYCKMEIDLGVISLEDVWLELHPGTDRDQAKEAIRRVELERERRALQAQLDQPIDNAAANGDDGEPAADEVDDEKAPPAKGAGKVGGPPGDKSAGKGAKST